MAFWEKWRKVRLFLEYILTTRVPEEAKKQVEYKYIYYNNISSLKIDFTSNQLKFFSPCMQELVSRFFFGETEFRAFPHYERANFTVELQKTFTLLLCTVCGKPYQDFYGKMNIIPSNQRFYDQIRLLLKS